MDILIEKRDKSTEPYSKDKLITSILKTGIPVDKTDNIYARVETWISENAKNGKILSTQIRDKVYEIMKSEFPIEADNYQTYKK